MGSQVMVSYGGVDEEWRHLKLMGDLRQLAKDHGGTLKYVQMSCLAAAPCSLSRLLRSKAAAEEAVLQNFADATILRTAPMVGVEDCLLNRWAIQAKKLLFVPIPGDGLSKLHPVLVVDVAAAVIAAIRDEGFSMSKTFELGGPDVFTVNELISIPPGQRTGHYVRFVVIHVALMFEAIREYPRVVHIPMFLAQLAAMPREIALKIGLPIPFSAAFSKDYLDQLACDLIVSPDAMGLSDLGVTSHKIGGLTIEHWNAYRTGGPSVGTTLGESTHGADHFF